ncbi:hypothetical protein V6N13_005397 [Hibiscus sabdariffa]
MTSVQEEEVVELKESYQDLEAQFNIASALLDMDGRELDDPFRHVGDWTQNQAKSIKKNRAWTKKATIHILVLAQQDPFAKKNNDKNHGGTNHANGKAPEESNMEDQNNFSYIRVQPEAHIPEKGTHFNTMRATARRW